MASIVFGSVLFMILTTAISMSQSELVEKSVPAPIGYEADYEIAVKTTNGKSYLAYIIDQEDIVIKKKCMCIAEKKCSVKNVIKLAK